MTQLTPTNRNSPGEPVGSDPSPEVVTPPPASEEVRIRPPFRARLLPWLATLASAALPYRIEDDDEGDSVILVPSPSADAVVDELASYEASNQNWPPAPRAGELPVATVSPVTVLLWALGSLFLLRFYVWSGPSHPQNVLFMVGALERAAFHEGQWWRVVTALTLHADGAHVLGNVAWGCLFGIWASLRVGPGVACFLILLSGIMGNGLEAYFSAAGHRSVGASTAGFGAVGLLCAFQFADNLRRWGLVRSIWSRTWLPVVAGAGMLAFTGTGPRADLLGHATGFLSGLGIGLAGRGLLRRRIDMPWQIVIFVGCGVFVMVCWRVALAHIP